MLQKEIRPKLSLEPSLSLRVEERPTPMAIIKGTVIGPVVTPPESNATAMKSAGAAKESKNQCGIEDTQQQGEAQLENDTQNGDDQKDTDAESDRPD